jgi:hypothetical protein
MNTNLGETLLPFLGRAFGISLVLYVVCNVISISQTGKSLVRHFLDRNDMSTGRQASRHAGSPDA